MKCQYCGKLPARDDNDIAEALRGLLAAVAENTDGCVDWACDGSGDMIDCDPGCRHKAAVDALAELDADVARAPECTGVAADWCPNCGDCECLCIEDAPDCDACNGEGVCPDCDGEGKVCPEGFTRETMGRYQNPACPLHGDDSKHAEASG